jgi:hypothetical protein
MRLHHTIVFHVVFIAHYVYDFVTVWMHEVRQVCFFRRRNARPMASDRTTGFDLPLQIGPHPPLPILGVITVLHCGAAACVWFTSLPLWIKLAASVLVGGSLLLTGRRYLRLTGLRLGLNARDQWFIIDRAGNSYPVTLVSGLFLHPALAILTVADEEAAVYPIFVSPLNADTDNRRRLRVRLRFRKAA